MGDTYWADAGDNGDSQDYGGNFYEDWQEAHGAGTDYYLNRDAPQGDVTFGAHNSQHITANRKAYAMWWILARIAGWDGSKNNCCPLGYSRFFLRKRIQLPDRIFSTSCSAISAYFSTFQAVSANLQWYPGPGSLFGSKGTVKVGTNRCMI